MNEKTVVNFYGSDSDRVFDHGVWDMPWHFMIEKPIPCITSKEIYN
jgi:hypothetical protein